MPFYIPWDWLQLPSILPALLTKPKENETMGHYEEALRGGRPPVIEYDLRNGPPPFPSDAPKPASEVWSQFKLLTDRVDTVGALIEKLEGRISSVLRPCPPATGADSCKQPAPPYGSTLAADLGGVSSRVEFAAARLRELLERVDL